MPLLDEIIKKIAEQPPETREKFKKAVLTQTKDIKWLPQPGPQSQAYRSPANILLFGGAGGGGKTDLGLGLAFTQHKRSLIVRRKYANLGALIDRSIEINGTRDGYNGQPPPRLTTKDGRLIIFAGNQHLGDESYWQGQPFDLKVFDEASQLLEAQVKFHLGWLRSVDPNQRVRALLASNPPISAEGDWMIGMFRPWLDVTHPNPAKHGELRWFVTAPDGSDLEVDGPEPIELDGRRHDPTSRSFIPSKLDDNAYLVRTGYRAQLDALPEPLRSAVRDGNFMAVRPDDENQVIPTSWVIEAQKRWHRDGWKAHRMTAMGVDVARGGDDETVIAARYAGWFAPLVSKKGIDTKDGPAVAALVSQHRRDGCPVVVDIVGWGASAYDHLKANDPDRIRGFNGAASGSGNSRSCGRVFANKRAEAWWRFREALDPNQEGGSIIALPDDSQLRADLTAPCLKPDIMKIQVESKEDIRKRIGRSPDKGDAVVMALEPGDRAEKRRQRSGFGWDSNQPPPVIRGFAAIKNRFGSGARARRAI
jgi:hypothetical protein